MLSRKQGPPVPPRPTAAAVANVLAGKNRGNSPPIPVHGRTIVYKSPPSTEKQFTINNINNNSTNNINSNNNDDNDELQIKRKVKISLSSSSSTSSNKEIRKDIKQKTDIIIVNNNKKKNNDNNTRKNSPSSTTEYLIDDVDDCDDENDDLCSENKRNFSDINFENVTNESKLEVCETPTQINNNKQEIKQRKSPIPKPRQITPVKSPLQNDINDMQSYTSTISSTSSSSSSSIVIQNSMHQNLIEITTTGNNFDATKNLPNIVNNNNNNNRINRNSFIIDNNDNNNDILKSTFQTDQIIVNSPSHAAAINQIEINNKNNKDNLNYDRTEITINSTKSSSSLNETKNMEFSKTKTEQCISVRNTTPSPPSKSTVRFNLSKRPEPEGGEFNNDFVKETIKPKPEENKLPIKDKNSNAFHELLISELAAMRKNENYVKKSVKLPSLETSPNGTQRSRIRTADWVEVGDNGKEVLLSSCQISLEDSGLEDEERGIDDGSSGVGDSWDSVKDSEERYRMSLPGLPPLPKSLSGIELTGIQQLQNSTPTFSSSDSLRGLSPITRMPSTLDTQLAILRREMFGLRQLDLSLLSQLWALNESIQEFRSILQEQETLSPPSPSPTPSDANSVSSEDEDDISLDIPINRMRSAPPPPPPNRKAPSRPV